MKMYRVRYNDPKIHPTEVYHSEKAWEGAVCQEIKGMLEDLGCTNATIVPESQIDPSQLKKRRIGSLFSG